MADLLALKRVRSSIKGSLTRMETFLSSNNRDEFTIDELKVRVETVQGLRVQFMEVEEKLFMLDSNIESKLDEFEPKYYSVSGNLNKWIRQLNETEHGAGRQDDSILNTTQAAHAEIKLKKLFIPPFSGEYTEWPSFYDLYKSSIHSKDYPAVQKFQYLKSLVTGEAAQLIRYFAVTEANYYEAFSKLVERYDRKKYIVNAFIRTFIDQPSVNQVSSSSIRKLCDTSDEVLRGLKALDPKAETRDSWLIYILIKKLDQETKMLWAQASTSSEYPTTKEFFEFLNNRCDALESIVSYSKAKPAYTRALVTETVNQMRPTFSCPVCKDVSHLLYECGKFAKMSASDRKYVLLEDKRCFNCLHKGHNVYNCRAKSRCKVCQRKHHSLIHEGYNETKAKTLTSHITQEVEIESKPEAQTDCCQTSLSYNMQAILPTATVQVRDSNGELKLCRALLDSASQVTFITEACVQKLGLKIASGRITVSGLGQSNLGRTKGVAQLEIMPRFQVEPKLTIQAYVVPKITTLQPATKIGRLDLDKLELKNLADPKFNENGHIDILLGVEVFFTIIESGQLKLSRFLIAQETKFGWVVGGRATEATCKNDVVNLNVTIEVDSMLRKFWEIESIPTANELNDEEKYCEDWFERTTERSNDGKFIVRLPARGDLTSLGSNYKVAEQRLKAMENKFKRNPGFKDEYVNFMLEYERLGHMRQINGTINQNMYFLPHHGVIKETSTTTKLRVVFDASSKDKNGKSLNDLLMTGPSIQSSLLEILIRFRRYRYVISGDVAKMYRQIWVDENDSKVQCILWRKDTNEPIKQYELKTLTYGTTPASFIATRCLMQSAKDNQIKYPEASAAIQKDMYVDDLMTGANDENELSQLREDIANILELSGFTLRKWTSNSLTIRNKLNDQAGNAEKLIIKDESIKLLGLQWKPALDGFCFAVHLTNRANHTKRTLLSEASTIFDPLGWLAPLTIRIKILFQSLWLRDLKWDDPLPIDVLNRWVALRDELKEVEKLLVPRWLEFDDEVELHGFSDASELAYSAVVYVKINSTVKLIAGKTRVSPIQQLSVPRLELLGAVLLTELVNTIKVSWANINIRRIVLWCDSKIVLDWLASHPRKWNAFVANRVSMILEHFPRVNWRHVPSKQNAADCASRGIYVCEFLNPLCIWWNGPDWLKLEPVCWPEQKLYYETEVERKSKCLDVLLNTTNDFIDNLLIRYNSFERMKRILAYVRRYITNLRSKVEQRMIAANRINHIRAKQESIEVLSQEELSHAEKIIIRYVQNQHFITEVKCLQRNQEIPKKSAIKTLNPFLDEDELIRVGGRIDNSLAAYTTKHPVILPNGASISKAIVLDLHLRWLHAGCGLLVSLVRNKYWIVRARDVARLVIHKCIKCIRYKPNLEHQLMGDLPPARVTYTHPFINVGIDYCGPFKVQQIRRRGQVPTKMYVCIFVCLCTKAVHIEVSSDMTTNCFMGVLRRFIARRGMCRSIYSDNGSNFIGANNQLRQWYAWLGKSEQYIEYELSKQEIQWYFNPASSPHMGGLWESAVKAMKSYLKKTVGETILTIEEFSTLLCQIESIMNSRPICAFGVDELDILTPGHFLIGRSMTDIPEPELLNKRLSPLARWEQVIKLKQHFQKRWQRDYLSSLQRRDKWHRKATNLEVGDMVLIADEYPSISWKLGKIVDVHPGADGRVRVVTVKTAHNKLKRPIHKLCRLPIHEIESEDSRPAGCSSSTTVQ